MQERPNSDAAILVVEDSPANLVAMEACLAPLGQRVERATTANEALRKLLNDDIALLLLDVHLPGMSGFELASLLKDHPRFEQLPIIFVTGVSREARHAFEGYAYGAVDYLLKPFDPELLRAKVAVFIELERRRRKIQDQERLLHEHAMRELRRRSEEQFHALAESMSIPLLAVRPDGQIIGSNAAWQQYSGAAADEEVPLCSARFVHPEDLGRLRDGWSSATGAGRPFEVECRLLRRDDASYRWHLLRGVAAASGGDGADYVVTATDIHSHKLLEAERARALEWEQRARRAAEAANQMKDEFLAVVSHELRTPLNAILGWCSMLESGQLDAEKVARAHQSIAHSAQVQSRLVSDLLDVSRIVTGTLRLQPGRLMLRDVVAEATDTVRHAAERKGVTLTFSDECPGDDVPMRGDGSRLQQVFWNLLSNAVKFTPAKGRVHVRLSREGGRARVTVEDDGAGIGADFLPHVFERFRQENGARTRRHEGLGLGLSIVKHIVELHGGSVTVASAGAGKGSSFTVELPLDAALVGSEPPAAGLETSPAA